MKITEELLKQLLDEAFEAGYHGSKGLQENVVHDLVDKAKQSEITQKTIEDTWKGILLSSPVPNANGDLFVTEPPILDLSISQMGQWNHQSPPVWNEARMPEYIITASNNTNEDPIV